MKKITGAARVKHIAGISLTGIALACESAYGQSIDSPAEATAAAAAVPASAAVADPNVVVVTGSYLRRPQEGSATPLVLIGQDQLKNTGTLQLGDLTRYIPQNIGSVGGLQDLAKGGVDSHDARSANLRGLGSGATLVLLNGRRFVPSEGYVNLNALIPSIAVRRVETLLGGASAVYGADAVAGVVNVISNDSFEGLTTSAQYTSLDKTKDYQTQLMVGAGNERFHIVSSFAYTFQGHLQNGDREVTNFYNPSSGSGANPGSYLLSSRPRTASGGDVIINGNNYSTLYDQRKNALGQLSVVDPNCGSAATQSVYKPAAGATFGAGSCAFSFQAQNPLRPESESLLGHNDATFEITPTDRLYYEGSYYHQTSKRFGVPSYAQNRNAGLGPVVPATNPYNPFGVDVQFSGRAIGSEGFAGYNYRVQQDEVNIFHNVIGGRGNLPFGDWQYNVDGVWSVSTTYTNDKDTDGNLFQAALNGYGGPNCNFRWNGPSTGAVAGQGKCLYLSPVAKDNATQSPDLLFNLQSDNITRSTRGLMLLDAVLNGTLMQLPQGKVALAVGAQGRREKQTSTTAGPAELGTGGFAGPNRSTSAMRDVSSVFAELGVTPLRGVDINAAVRSENYGTIKATSPKIEANWEVLPRTVFLRVSAGRSFQAPGVDQATDNQISVNVQNIADPLKGTTTFRTIITQGNPLLQPQRAKVYNFGTTFRPVAKASISVDYWIYNYVNQFGTQDAQAVINANPNDPAVLRDTNGVAQTILVKSFNAPSGTKTSGVDLDASYGFNALGGKVSLREALTYLVAYDIDTGSKVYDGIGRRNNAVGSPVTAAAAPRVRSQFTADYKSGPNSVNLTWRYASSVYEDYGLALSVPLTSKIKGLSVADAQYSRVFGMNDRYALSVGATNLFDRKPGAAVYTGYLPSIADALGRQVYVRASASF